MKKLAIVAATVATMAASGASASTLSGEFWDAPNDTGPGLPAPGTFSDLAGAIAYATSNAKDADFVATDINYGDAATNWAIDTLSDFLNADAASIDPTTAGGLDFQESVIRLTGKVLLNDGDQIDVTSDDGFRLIIGGNTFTEFTGLRGPNNTTSGTWSGGDGVFDVTLWYFEGNESQAQLISNLGDYVAPIPLPAAGWMLLAGIGGIAAMKRRKKA